MEPNLLFLTRAKQLSSFQHLKDAKDNREVWSVTPKAQTGITTCVKRRESSLNLAQ